MTQRFDMVQALGSGAFEQLDALFDALSDGLWICDATPRLLWINKACETLNEINRVDVCGKLVSDLLGIGNFDHDVTSQVLKTRNSVAINQKVKSGRTLLVNGAPVFDDSGEIIYVVGTERDLTDLNILRTELEKSQKLASKINSELLALKMKELKTTQIVAESEAMERVLDTALKVAQFDTTILITGPSGSGKGLIARVVHESSSRKDKPFLSVNCGAIPSTLLEAELFGYAPGAFTGAKKGGKPGLLDVANGGTVFLDEIDALAMSLQVKLLTFLDTQSFIPVGGTTVQQVDVRLIAATNKNIADLVSDGDFREDLWFRLNVVPLALPALRTRPDDIPPLVRAYTNTLNDRYGVKRTVSRDAMDLLCRFEFPGNVRQLQNILERSFVFCEGDRIQPDDLPEEIRVTTMRKHYRDRPARLEDALYEVEHDIVAAAMAAHDRQVDVAKALGVSQPTVARLLKKHGLSLKQSIRS